MRNVFLQIHTRFSGSQKVPQHLTQHCAAAGSLPWLSRAKKVPGIEKGSFDGAEIVPR